VAPTGSDSNKGTQTSPLKSLTAAVAASRSLVAPKAILMEAGTYYEGKTVELTAADSDLAIAAVSVFLELLLKRTTVFFLLLSSYFFFFSFPEGLALKTLFGSQALRRCLHRCSGKSTRALPDATSGKRSFQQGCLLTNFESTAIDRPVRGTRMVIRKPTNGPSIINHLISTAT